MAYRNLNVLEDLATQGDWQAMGDVLNSLGASAQRVASSRLKNEILPGLQGESFWECFVAIVPLSTKAYLGTFLKVAAKLYDAGKIDIRNERLRRFADETAEADHSIDMEKTLQTFLPIVRTTDEVYYLLEAFHLTTSKEKIEQLVDHLSPKTCYVLFMEMRKTDSEPQFLTQVCNRLLVEGSRIAYNLVSIAKEYFDLRDVKARFSLNIGAYQLSNLEKSEEDFEKILLSI